MDLTLTYFDYAVRVDYTICLHLSVHPACNISRSLSMAYSQLWKYTAAHQKLSSDAPSNDTESSDNNNDCKRNDGESSYFFNEPANPELEHRAEKVSERFSENVHIIGNEPSLAFYRIQEHVRKTVPQLLDKKHEVQKLHKDVQGCCFDTEYAINAVKGMEGSRVHFQTIQDLLKNAMFMKQQIQYEQSRKQQERVRPSMYRAMMRTQTVDASLGPSDLRAEFTHSLHLPTATSLSQLDDSPRARSSSLTLQDKPPPRPQQEH